jgi:hypothetical protein
MEKSKHGGLSYTEKTMLSFLHPGHGRQPKKLENIRRNEKRIPTIAEMDTGNQLEISNCEQKSAYILNSEELGIEMNFLSSNHFEKQFYTGKGNMIDKNMMGYQIQNVRNTKIGQNYRWMINSGIYDRLQEEEIVRNTKIRNSVKIEKIVQNENKRIDGVSSLEGGLITLFILCGGLVSLTLTCFILECRHILWEALKYCYYFLSSKVLKCWRRWKGIKLKCHRRRIHVSSSLF